MEVTEIKGYSILPRSQEQKPHNRIQFSVMHGAHHFKGNLFLSSGYSVHFISPSNMVLFTFVSMTHNTAVCIW